MRRFEAACLLVAAAGVCLRLFALDAGALVDDSGWYAWMARSFLERGEFYLPDGSGHTQHFPPLFPLYLATWFALLGPKVWVVGLAVLFVAAAFVAATYAMTRDLFGRERAAVAAAVAGAFPFLLQRDMQGLSETFVALLFTATVWAILKSLRDPRFIVLGGLFAGLGYLAKASMGPFFLLAGGAGFAWRFAYVRWRVFRDVWYLGAAALFLGLVATWAARNQLRFGSIDSQPHATESLRILFAGAWLPTVSTSIAWSFFLVGCFVLPILPWVFRSLRRIRDEATSALWLAVALPTFIAAFFVAAFTVAESSSITRSDLVFRYIMTPLVPLVWLALREVDLADGSGPPRRALLLAGGLVLGLTFALAPVRTAITSGRVLATLAGLVVGIGLVAASGRPRWTSFAGAAASFALAFVVPGQLTFVLFGAAACFFVAQPRWRAGLFVALLLAVSLSGTVEVTGLQTTVDEVAARVPPGGSVFVLDDDPFLPAFLPDHVRVTQDPRGADAIVVMWGDEREPPGYELVHVTTSRQRALPGTVVERWIEGALGLDPPPLREAPTGRVFVPSGP